MPRVENVGPAVDGWCDRTGEASSTVDVCNACYVDLMRDPHFYSGELDAHVTGSGVLLDKVGPPIRMAEPFGEDGWQGDVAHPDYEDDEYECAVCHVELGEEDS